MVLKEYTEEFLADLSKGKPIAIDMPTKSK